MTGGRPIHLHFHAGFSNREKNYQKTAYLFIFVGHDQVAEQLIQKGVNINFVTLEEGNPALALAALNGR